MSMNFSDENGQAHTMIIIINYTLFPANIHPITQSINGFTTGIKYSGILCIKDKPFAKIQDGTCM